MSEGTGTGGGATVWPASHADAPPSDDCDIDIRPDAAGEDPRARRDIVALPIRERVTVTYTAGPCEENAGEAMVVRGPTTEVRSVLHRAGYRAVCAVPREEAGADGYSLASVRRILDRLEALEVRAVETGEWTFEIELASETTRAWVLDRARGEEVGTKVAAALADGMAHARADEPGEAAEARAPIGEPRVEEVSGTHGCRLRIDEAAAREIVEPERTKDDNDRGSVVAMLIMLSVGLKELKPDPRRG